MSPYLADVCRVLVIEDNPGDAEMIRESLLEGQYTVSAASQLSEGLRLLERDVPDVVLLDLNLPDGTGVECVDRVRTHANNVPIVVLTGGSDDALALACIRAGAQDYLKKGEVRPADAQRAIAYAMARAKEVTERGRADALERQLAAIVDNSREAILSTTIDGVVVSWNRGAERIFGFSPLEAIGRSASEVIRRVDGGSAVPPLEPESGDGQPIEIQCLRKDGMRVSVSFVWSRFLDASGRGVALSAIGRDVTEARRRDDELKQRNAELEARDHQMRALTVRLHEIREGERTRISRTVHDELGALLTALKFDLRWCEKRVSVDRAVAERLREAGGLVDQTVKTVQRIAVELRPSALDTLGLPAAIRDEVRRFSERTEITPQLRLTAETPTKPEVATVLFRVFQELLTNVARHAKASHVEVALESIDGHWVLRVTDDGVGVGHDNPGARSLGLLGIRERLQALGGSFLLEGEAGLGTRAVARVPN